MNNKEQSAETTNEQSTEVQVTTGSHSNGNTHVVGSQSQVHRIKNAFTNKDDFWIEYTPKSPPAEKR